MDIGFFKNTLIHGAEAVKTILSEITEEQAKWKPAPDKWSLLEVLNHLYDEEILDFRGRLELTLRDPKEPWPPNDPEAWVVERKYNERNLEESLGNFLEEREKSIAWLEGLESPNWDNTYEHPIVGKLSAGDLLASWAAHDFLHIRQMAMLRVEYVTHRAKPYSTRYAVP